MALEKHARLMEGPTPAWAERKTPLSHSREKVAVTTLNQSRLNRLLAQAIAAYTQGKWKEALDVSNQIYQIDACWLDNILLLGASHFQLRNFSEAIFYSQQVILLKRMGTLLRLLMVKESVFFMVIV